MKRVPGRDTRGKRQPDGNAERASVQPELARRTGRYKDVPTWPSDADWERERYWRKVFGDDPNHRGTIGDVEDLDHAVTRMRRVLGEDRDSFTVQADRVRQRKKLTRLLTETAKALQEIQAPGLTMPTDFERRVGLLSSLGFTDAQIKDFLAPLHAERPIPPPWSRCDPILLEVLCLMPDSWEATTIDTIRKARERLPRFAYLGLGLDGKAVLHKPMPRRRGRPPSK